VWGKFSFDGVAWIAAFALLAASAVALVAEAAGGVPPDPVGAAAITPAVPDDVAGMITAETEAPRRSLQAWIFEPHAAEATTLMLPEQLASGLRAARALRGRNHRVILVDPDGRGASEPELEGLVDQLDALGLLVGEVTVETGPGLRP